MEGEVSAPFQFCIHPHQSIGMVHYNLAGRVNSEEFAICDRLLGAFVIL